MPVYKTGMSSAATPANGSAYLTFNSATRKALIHQIDLSLLTATQSQVGLGIPANEATPPVASTTIVPQGRPSDAAATARFGTAWSTAPTAPSVMIDEKVLAAVIGSGWSLKWAPDEYEEVKIAGWRTLWNRGGGAAGTLLVSLTYDE